MFHKLRIKHLFWFRFSVLCFGNRKLNTFSDFVFPCLLIKIENWTSSLISFFRFCFCQLEIRKLKTALNVKKAYTCASHNMHSARAGDIYVGLVLHTCVSGARPELGREEPAGRRRVVYCNARPWDLCNLSKNSTEQGYYRA